MPIRVFILAFVANVLVNPAFAALSFNPASPIVEAGQFISLTIDGAATGSATWQAKLGKITEGTEYYAEYQAPDQADVDTVSFTDSAGNSAELSILVLAEGGFEDLFKPENATWDIYNHRGIVRGIAHMAGSDTLWVGTNGGLEQRDVHSGEVQRIYTTQDGLPANNISALFMDAGGGLWIGTGGGFARELKGNGLAYRAADGQLAIYTQSNSSLPSNTINALISDGDGGIWIGVGADGFDGGLVHIDKNGAWQAYNRENTASLPGINVIALALDNNKRLWLATYDPFGGVSSLLFRTANGDWGQETPSQWDLSNTEIHALAVDSTGNLWAGGDEYKEGATLGLLYRDGSANWHSVSSACGVTVDTETERDPGVAYSLLAAKQGGVWAGQERGFVHVDANGGCQSFNAKDIGFQAYTRTYAFLETAAGLWADASWTGVGNIGLAYYSNADKTWATFPQQLDMPYNRVVKIDSDEAGGLWVGTDEGGLSRRFANGEWKNYSPDDNTLATYYVQTLYSFGGGGVWVGSDFSGLYLSQDLSSGYWDNIDTDNGLPANSISAIEFTYDGTLWLGTPQGLAFTNDVYSDSWTVLTSDNSDLPSNNITALRAENTLIWVATDQGLALASAATARVYPVDLTFANASLNTAGVSFYDDIFDDADPSFSVTALLSEYNGLWLGTDTMGLAFLSNNGVQVMHEYNSGLPSNQVRSLATDNSGSLWIGTDKGLAFRSAKGDWQVFNTDNSSLPDNDILSVYPDNSGGVWLGTLNSGMVNLKFSAKTELADSISNTTARRALLNDKRAAIMIHPRGQSNGYNQELALDFMASYAYHTLHARGYDNKEIMFLSYKPDLDFNGDGRVDAGIVDGPVTLQSFRGGTKPRDLTVADVESALNWAQNQGTLSQPLILIFIDHGIPGALLLDPQGNQTLTGQHLDSLLDKYQAATGNQVVVLLEACHSGSLVSALTDPRRLIVSSTDDGLAYYDDLGRNSFIKLYFDQLRGGENFWQSLNAVKERIANYRRPLNNQKPQLAGDTLAKSLCLNGCFGNLPGVLTMTVENTPAVVQAGEKLDLKVKTNAVGVKVDSMWASVITPQVAAQRTEQGYSRQPEPIVRMRRSAEGNWNGRFDEFSTNGDYVFTFKAKDNKGFISETKPLNMSVASGTQSLVQPRFDFATFTLTMPAMTFPLQGKAEQTYAMNMKLNPDNFVWTVDMSTFKVVTDTTNVALANFNPTTGKIHIPVIELVQNGAVTSKLSMDVTLLNSEGTIQFNTDLASLK